MPRLPRWYSTWLVAQCAPPGSRDQFLHVARVEVRHAPVADLARRPQLLERLDRLGQRMAAAPVQQIEVDPVGAQPLQAALARRRHAAARGVVRIHLADDEQPVALALRWLRPTTSSAPPLPYISAVSISVMPSSMPSCSAATSAFARAAALAHVPGALAERRHLGPVRQPHRAHHAAALLGNAQHAQEVAAPQRGDLLPVVAAAQQLGGDVRRSRRRRASR